MRKNTVPLLLAALLIFGLITALVWTLWPRPSHAAWPIPTGTATSFPTATFPAIITPGVTITHTPPPTPVFCGSLERDLLAAYPASGLRFATTTYGSQLGRLVFLQGVTTGETRIDGQVYLARMAYASGGNLHGLWFATGFEDPSGTYFPMNLPGSLNYRAWSTPVDAENVFHQVGVGVYLSLTGFLRNDAEITWESCPNWEPSNPHGICALGQELEFASHGGSAQFLQTGIPPEGWFAFGWRVDLIAGVPIPKNVGACLQ